MSKRSEPQPFDTADPLAICASESARAHTAFLQYERLGPGRSLTRLCEELNAQHARGESVPTLHIKTLHDWSHKFQWAARIAEMGKAEALQRAAIRAARRIELEERDWEAGGQLREKAQQLIEQVPNFIKRSVRETTDNGERIRVVNMALNATPAQMAQALKVASDLQRASVADPPGAANLPGNSLVVMTLDQWRAEVAARRAQAAQALEELDVDE